MSEKVRILGVGVATMDIYIRQKRMYPGGNEFNVACHAGRQGCEAGFLGVFGNDLAGKLLEQTLIDCKVDVSRCRHETGCSGYSLVELRDDGDRVFLFWTHEGVTDRFPVLFTQEELAYAAGFDVLCCGRCADVSTEKLKLLKEHGIDICYDFHASFTTEEIRSVAPSVKYAFFSCSHLTEPEIRVTLQQAVSLGCRLAIGTRGDRSLFAWDGSRLYEQEPLKVEARDTLGAGDSFISAFLAAYLSHKAAALPAEVRLKQALLDAAAYAAQVVQLEGSLGFGFDADPENLSELVNLSETTRPAGFSGS